MTEASKVGVSELLPCPFCGGAPEIVDDRTGFFVRCNGCKPFATVIYGENVRYLDHITADTDKEADRLSEIACAAVDWDALKQTAIAAWNRRATPSPAVQETVTDDRSKK